MIRLFRTKQFLLFLITGAVAAVVNFSSRIFYSQWLDFSSSVVLAYVTGMFTAFVLAKCFVFHESRQALGRSVTAFVVVNLLAVLQTWGVSVLMAYYLLPWLGVTRLVPEISHGLGVVVPVFTSYLGHRHWSFR